MEPLDGKNATVAGEEERLGLSLVVPFISRGLRRGMWENVELQWETGKEAGGQRGSSWVSTRARDCSAMGHENGVELRGPGAKHQPPGAPVTWPST